MSELTLPLFPLHAVVFPEGRLPLRIFEPRYVDMIGECLRNDNGFGVCLIREGSETGEGAEVFEVGTLAFIRDWDRTDDGLLGVTAEGHRRFEVLEQWVQPNQLVMARVAPRPLEPRLALPGRFSGLSNLLAHILERASMAGATLTPRYHDATWVGARLGELLPLPLAVKQELLELDDPIARLDRLQGLVGSAQH